jgi:hypothetical protein
MSARAEPRPPGLGGGAEEADGAALGVVDDGDASDAGQVEGIDDDFSPEGNGVFRGGVDIFDGDVGNPLGVHLGDGGFHEASDHFIAFFEKGVVHAFAKGLGGPAEKLAVEFFGGFHVRGDKFVPTEVAGFDAIFFAHAPSLEGRKRNAIWNSGTQEKEAFIEARLAEELGSGKMEVSKTAVLLIFSILRKILLLS